MAMKDYNGSNFKNTAIDKLSGKFGKGDGDKGIPERFNRQGARAADKLNKSQEKLDKYVNSTKAPSSTKDIYNQAKPFLGGYYDGKPLNRMTDIDYNDKKTLKIKSKADKAEVKMEKIYDRAQKNKAKKNK